MTSAVTDTGYWLAEATGDDNTDVFDAGGEPTEHHHTTDASDSHIDIDHIQSILNPQNPVAASEDMGVDNTGIKQVDREDMEEIPLDSPDAHPDPNVDASYTLRPRHTPAPSQKVLLNNKWSNSKMWAQRAMAHTKCDKTLESERLCCRQAMLCHEDSDYHDFEPDFDLAAAVQQITEMRCHQAMAEVDDFEPLTYQQAMAGPYAKQWKEAMDKQMESFATMETWKLVPRAQDMPVLTGRWVYKIKKKLDRSTLYKARWVVQGFEQTYGVNYDQTFASVVKSMSFKALFAIMAHYDLDCEQMDVITAFLNAPLKETIYVEQSKGYEQGGNMVCLLQRALYGLKQSPHKWYFTLRQFLESKGFKHTESNYLLFVNETTRLIVSVYVNNIQIYGPKRSKHIAKLKQDLHKRFAMTDLGPCSYYLGMEIQRNFGNKTVRVTQTTYLKKVLA